MVTMMIKVMNPSQTKYNHSEKRRLDQARYRARHRARLNEQTRLHREEMRQYAYSLLTDHCVECGSRENLEFDHLHPHFKQEKLSLSLNRNKEFIAKEAPKCQVLCRSCHMEKTKRQRELSWRLFTSLTPELMDAIMDGELSVYDLEITSNKLSD